MDTNGVASPDLGLGAEDDYRIDQSQFAFEPRKLRVVCIGAGFAGLFLAHKLKHERPLDFVDFTIYEKNSEVGGTWLENVYPGVACDIPAHGYQFPFAPNPAWSKFYVGGAEIQRYITNTADKYGLRENVTFNTKLVKAIWDEEQGKWKLELEQGGQIVQDEAHVLINGSGILNKWKWPEIEGIESFGGTLLHTARWDSKCDWTGKKVAVIGNGSSALQVVPAIQPKCAKLVNYIRNPTWVSINLCADVTKDGMGTNFTFTEEEIKQFESNPDEYHKYRKRVEQSINSVYSLMLSGSEANEFVFNLVDGIMRKRLEKNPHLIEKLIPKYEIGCRRLSPGDGYLEALQEENADISFNGIKRITKNGIVTDEGEEQFDIIVCATGFNNTFIPLWEMAGQDGRRLDVEWKETPQAYFSICAAGIPNYFMFTGPNCPIGHGSVHNMLGWTADYMLDWIEKIAQEDIKSTVVKDQVVHQYNRFARESLSLTVWSKGCQSWYKGGKGGDSPVTVMYPGSALHYKAAIKTIRGEHFNIKYNTTNPFRCLGNGRLAFEVRENADLAFYM
ncbi:hypothetical protein FQN53_006772 [Emmonsiellopsis sp. PD_33]|nr:hypothetical protein FQN53_006772 [Emmonsiellopsis sp. PD_33]